MSWNAIRVQQKVGEFWSQAAKQHLLEMPFTQGVQQNDSNSYTLKCFRAVASLMQCQDEDCVKAADFERRVSEVVMNVVIRQTKSVLPAHSVNMQEQMHMSLVPSR